MSFTKRRIRTTVWLLLVMALAGGAGASGEPPDADPVRQGRTLPLDATDEVEGPVLTLEQAIAAALESNPELAAREAEARAAQAGVRESRAARWPQLEVTADAGRTTDPVAVFGGLLRQERFAERNFDPDLLNEPDPLTNYRGLVSVEQSLWAGGGITSGVEGARREAEAAGLLRERARQELAYRVLDRYTGAVVAEQGVAVRRDSLEAAREAVRLTRDRFETGLAVESDLLQARVRESEAEAALAEAEAEAALGHAALNLEMGRDLDTVFSLPDSLPEGAEAPEAPGAEEGLEALVAEAGERRPDLRAAAVRVEAARAGLQAARAGRLPSFGWRGSFEADAEDPSDDPGSHWSVGLGLTWTGFDGFATGARIEAARARLEQAERLAEAARRGVALEVESALRRLDAARLRVREAGEAVTLAERSAAIVRDRYREGLTTVVELLGAETLIAASRTRELQAQRDLALARGRLELATGRF